MCWPVNHMRGLYNAYGPPGREAVQTVQALYEKPRERGEKSSILARSDLNSLEGKYGHVESFQVTGRRPTWARGVVVVSVDVHRTRVETREQAEVWIPNSSMKFPPHVNRVKLNSVVASR